MNVSGFGASHRSFEGWPIPKNRRLAPCRSQLPDATLNRFTI